MGDGAEEGPTGSKLGAAQAERLGLTPPHLYGNLDVYHSIETACGHVDTLCAARGIIFHERFRQVMKQARTRFHSGALSMLPKEQTPHVFSNASEYFGVVLMLTPVWLAFSMQPDSIPKPM